MSFSELSYWVPDWELDAEQPWHDFVFAFQQNANSLAILYGGPVFLVGSGLTKAAPRDWDVRIVISELDRLRLFGSKDTDWIDGFSQWGPARWRLELESLRACRRMGERYKRFRFDLQIQELDYVLARHRNSPRLRLDSAPDDIFAWPSRA